MRLNPANQPLQKEVWPNLSHIIEMINIRSFWGAVIALSGITVVVIGLLLREPHRTESVPQTPIAAITPSHAMAAEVNDPAGKETVPGSGTARMAAEQTPASHGINSTPTEPVPVTASRHMDRLPGARVHHAAQTRPGSDGTFRRVSIIQPVDLPYRVRIEDIMRLHPHTGEETLLERMEAVADHLLVNLADASTLAAAATYLTVSSVLIIFMNLLRHGFMLSERFKNRG